MFRSHVPAVQTSKAHAIVNSAGKRNRPTLRESRSQSRPIFLSLSCSASIPGRSAIGPQAVDRQRGDLERVGRSRHRRCDPGRVHRLLHPRLLVTHLRFTKLDFSLSDPLAESATFINANQERRLGGLA